MWWRISYWLNDSILWNVDNYGRFKKITWITTIYMLFHSIGQVIFGIHFTRYRFLHRCARIKSTHHDTDSGSCRSSAERSMERCCAPITTTAASASSRSDDDVDQRSAQRSRTEQLLPQQRRPGKPASQFSSLSLSLFLRRSFAFMAR